ncbi:GAF and ANTAR domain-containing protein [Nocardia terpenica]|uniref:ANTAR domain-containing protein n=1 Tax=Nocardia terpenica TaxID=455432 RepID=A0A6G9Z4L6_9NOCA|nr:GAF and ANTAR domain-containing protein [Nocardia terpenica]QIS19953.1 ANTAR domain-containing protein [Nocardia terpenica]
MRDADVPDVFAEAVRELSAVVTSSGSAEAAIGEVVLLVSRLLPGRPMAAVTLHHEGTPETVAPTDGHTAVIDAVQCDAGVGPCWDVVRGERPVWVPDVAGERRWGDYPARMLAHGVRSIYSRPMWSNGTVIGAFNLYSTRSHGFDASARQAAGYLTVVLSAVFERARQAALTGQLREALASRSVIDQALGIVMGRCGCDRDAAFDVLRQTSQQRNIKLAEVAAQTVRTVTGAAPPPPHFDVSDPGKPEAP